MEEFYFGTGGLVRAYSESLQKAIEKTKIVEKCEGNEIEIKLEYSDFEKLKYYCEKKKINVVDIRYEENIVCKLEILEDQIEKILEEIELKSIKIKEHKFLGKKLITKK